MLKLCARIGCRNRVRVGQQKGMPFENRRFCSRCRQRQERQLAAAVRRPNATPAQRPQNRSNLTSSDGCGTITSMPVITAPPQGEFSLRDILNQRTVTLAMFKEFSTKVDAGDMAGAGSNSADLIRSTCLLGHMLLVCDWATITDSRSPTGSSAESDAPTKPE
jgi:hypothetical protein